MFQTEASRERWTARAAWIALGISLAALGISAFGVGWQVYTYVESREETPMVHLSFVQHLKGPKFALDPKGEISVEVTNLGHRTMQVRNITLFAGKRVWVLHAPSQNQPTMALETGVTYSAPVAWDYAKHPLLNSDESLPEDLSLPEDFVVEIETTRAVHRRHFQISSITVTADIPSP